MPVLTCLQDSKTRYGFWNSEGGPAKGLQAYDGMSQVYHVNNYIGHTLSAHEVAIRFWGYCTMEHLY